MKSPTMTSSNSNCAPRPVATINGRTPYRSGRGEDACDLLLDSNEGLASEGLIKVLTDVDPTSLQRYPDTRELEGDLARQFGVANDQVLVTNGGDEAIDRICRSYLDPSRNLLQHVPTFEMIQYYASLTGATIETVTWHHGAFPIDAMLNRVNGSTGVIAVVSPNNPTGSVVGIEDIVVLSSSCSQAVVLLDLAYVEFADDDVTEIALELPNVLVVRTFSKARGLAGLRIGYVIGRAELVEPLRIAGGPFPVSGISVAVARQQLATGDATMNAYVQQVRREREDLTRLLNQLGASAQLSQGNFVLCQVGSAQRMHTGLLERGIAVRAFPDRPELSDAIRMTCPGHPAGYARLCTALGDIAADDPSVFLCAKSGSERFS